MGWPDLDRLEIGRLRNQYSTFKFNLISRPRQAYGVILWNLMNTHEALEYENIWWPGCENKILLTKNYGDTCISNRVSEKR